MNKQRVAFKAWMDDSRFAWFLILVAYAFFAAAVLTAF
jgi:hypothetical protein